MLRLLAVPLLLAVAAAPAAALTQDGLGFAVDLDGGIVVHTTTSAPFQQISVYLCAYEPSFGGVSGWECAVEVEGDAAAGAWALAGGLDVDPDDTNFQVGIGLGSVALRPGTTGLVHLATWTGFIPGGESVSKFFIKPYPGSSTFDEAAGYVGPGSLEDLATFTTPGSYNVHDLQINGINEAFQESSWSAVKELYR